MNSTWRAVILGILAPILSMLSCQVWAGTPVQEHWAFRPPQRPAFPPVQRSGWIRNAIDYFILARLEAAGLQPSPEADRATLIRRVSLDLIGLPPSAGELQQFVADPSEDAYEKLVDRLLASPNYGERWGRHWLDLARYADSNGYTRDFAREIWKYRDWVINALNRGEGFDQFTIAQIAGDLLPNATMDQVIATGFHRNTLVNEEGGTDAEQFRVDAVADRVATTGSVFLGLTLGCARCHDHKYDPITQREYYQIFAFLNQCDEPSIEAPSSYQIASGALERRAAIRRQVAELQEQLRKRWDEFVNRQIAWEKAITPEQRARLPGPTQEAIMKPYAERTDEQKRLAEELYKGSVEAQAAFPLLARVAELRASEPQIPTTMIMKQRSEARQTHVQIRGNFLDEGEAVQPAVPAVLHSLPAGLARPDRLDFARWLVDPRNPLTPRVIVNRYWQRFFGRGLVETENDFGTQGDRPSHPELLDWLATEFIRQDWNVKALHRLIVTSATYRQSCGIRPGLDQIDPQNRLLARQSRRRLEAEAVRDVALAASGLLTQKLGGPSVFPPQPEGVFDFTQDPKPWKTALDSDRFRRGMYTHLWRSSPYPALVVFDFPEANVTCTRRLTSNTPLQALTLANDLTFMECAQALARRALEAKCAGDVERLCYVFGRCLARQPSDAELARLIEFLHAQRVAYASDAQAARLLSGCAGDDPIRLAEQAAWTALARVLMNLDEFITRE